LTQSFFHQNLQFARAFSKKLNERLAEIGLYHSQWMIVFYLHSFGAATLVEISNYLRVEKPTITRTVNRLEKRQLIEKVPSKDKRERRIQLTEKGLRVFREAQAVVSEFERLLLEGIPDSDRETTQKTLQRLREKLL